MRTLLASQLGSATLQQVFTAMRGGARQAVRRPDNISAKRERIAGASPAPREADLRVPARAFLEAAMTSAPFVRTSFRSDVGHARRCLSLQPSKRAGFFLASATANTAILHLRRRGLGTTPFDEE